jgi:hypothetical protein
VLNTHFDLLPGCECVEAIAMPAQACHAVTFTFYTINNWALKA